MLLYFMLTKSQKWIIIYIRCIVGAESYPPELIITLLGDFYLWLKV